MNNIYGRKPEMAELKRLYDSPKAEFLAVYGRRRVGKTFLITRFFDNKFAFYHSGLSPYVEKDEDDCLKQMDADSLEDANKNKMRDQLDHFSESLMDCGCKLERPLANWREAFRELKNLIKPMLSTHERIVIFIDELPWMDTPKSGFLKEFESFCNSFACRFDSIFLIVAGSNITWIDDFLINGYGGLYDRLTTEMKLSPLSLKETEEYLSKGKGISFSRYDLTFAYMVFGGIPYYLDKFQKGKSLPAIIDQCFFEKNSTMRKEFRRLFLSSFRKGKEIQRIVEILSKRSIGYTRDGIIKGLGMSSGSNISDMLDSLEHADFIMKYNPLGERKNMTYYRLIDPFCLFYLRFVKSSSAFDEKLFSGIAASNAVRVWRGFAFETVCFNHISQIKKALGIVAVATNQYAYLQRGCDESQGAQIDLVIDRADNIVNLCEIKFFKAKYEHDKSEHERLLNKEASLEKAVLKTKSIRNVLITTIGIIDGIYAGDFDSVITLDDLFE